MAWKHRIEAIENYVTDRAWLNILLRYVLVFSPFLVVEWLYVNTGRFEVVIFGTWFAVFCGSMVTPTWYLLEWPEF